MKKRCQLFFVVMVNVGFFASQINAVFVTNDILTVRMYDETCCINALGDHHSDDSGFKSTDNEQVRKIVEQVVHTKKNNPHKKIACFAEMVGKNLPFPYLMDRVAHYNHLFDNPQNINRERTKYSVLPLNLFHPRVRPDVELVVGAYKRAELNGAWTEHAKDATLGQYKKEFEDCVSQIRAYCQTTDRSLPHIQALERRLHKAVRMFTRMSTVFHTLKMNDSTTILQAARTLACSPVIRTLFQKKQHNRVYFSSGRLFDACVGCDFDAAIKNGSYDHILYVAGAAHTKWITDKFFKANTVRRQDIKDIYYTVAGRSYYPLMQSEQFQIGWDNASIVKPALPPRQLPA